MIIKVLSYPLSTMPQHILLAYLYTFVNVDSFAHIRFPCYD